MKTRRTPERLSPFLLIYFFYLSLLTLAPFAVSVDPSLSLAALYVEKFEGLEGFCCVSGWDIVTNVILFIPFGYLLISTEAVSRYGPVKQILLAGFYACLLSFTIESCQLVLPRSPSMVDLVLNTLGGIVGAGIAIMCSAPISRVAHQCWMALERNQSLPLISLVYLLALLPVYSLPLPVRPDLSNWDPHFPFQLGNEASFDLPWLGEIYLVALYDRALNRGEVWTNFSAGPFKAGARKRIGEGVIVLYDFTEGTGDVVHDRVISGTPLDLRIQDPMRVRWITPNGIAIREGTVMTSSGSPAKLSAGRLSSRNELSVEAWIVPANLSQRGLACIVSYSKDPYERNFTLAQQERDLVFRLRTPTSGSNGTSPDLRTSDQPLAPALQHVVVTYQDRRETLYLNGAEHGMTLLRAKIALLDKLIDLLGTEFKWPLWSLFVFPLGVLPYFFYKRQMHRCQHVAFVSFISTPTVLVFLEGIRMMTLKSPDEPSFVLATAGSTALLSLVVASRLSRSTQLN